MSSFPAQMRKRAEQLHRMGADVKAIIAEVARDATIEAVAAAQDATPPQANGLSGTDTRTGALSQAWAKDSETTPVNGRTVLANNLEYASYVNDGHRVDKHFVPGLIINGGMLEMTPDSPSEDDGGLVVGTRTTYVKGLYMKEKGIGKYRTTVRTMLSRKVREMLQ